MRIALLLTLCFSAFQFFACPACNIHNYLSASVSSSTQIFLAEVVGSKDYSKAELRVIKILKDDTAALPFANDYYLRGLDTIRSTLYGYPNTRDSNVIVDKVIEHHLYNAKDKIGETYIFMNPVSGGVTFSLVYPSAEREIELLIAKQAINNTEDALVMLNGISIESVYQAIDFFDKSHGGIILDDLKKLLRSAEKDPFVEFGDYRVNSHLKALFELDRDLYTDSIVELLSSVNFEMHYSHFKKDNPSLGKTVLGALTRYSLELNEDDPNKQKKLIEELERLILSDKDCAPLFAAYGLSFVPDYKWKKTLSVLTDSKKKEVAKGMYWAGLWMRVWYRKDELDKLRPLIVKLDHKLSDEVEDRLTFKH